ncbi:MAG: Mut7-C RNAse domain-containing protein [Thermodesulfobacteriota bacterium]
MTAFRTKSHKTAGMTPGFDVDGSLGRLAKWLRIVGLDAEYPVGKPRPGRFFVTARSRVIGLWVIQVSGRSAVDQLAQVLAAADLRVDRELLFSRCLICNVPVEDVTGEQMLSSVPSEIAGHISAFTACPRCGRIYWAGTHLTRVLRRLAESGLGFDPEDEGSE